MFVKTWVRGGYYVLQ